MGTFGTGAGIGATPFGTPPLSAEKLYCMQDLLDAMRKKESYPTDPGADAWGIGKGTGKYTVDYEEVQARNQTPKGTAQWRGKGIISDGGNSFGPFQIWKIYFDDAVGADLKGGKYKWDRKTSFDTMVYCSGFDCAAAMAQAKSKGHWLELDESSGRWYSKWSECIVIAYMRRHANRSGRGVPAGAVDRLCACKGTLADCEVIARIHNGGPQGCKKGGGRKGKRGENKEKDLQDYWKGVRGFLTGT